ncbi:MAG: DUF882 domain-containing protein [Phycisphaerales bacterium]|nr:DUF882 domain-containing protein [Hyphomonadaceae bacterium]
MNRRNMIKFTGGAVLNGALVGGVGAAALLPANATTAQAPLPAAPSAPVPDARLLAFVNTHTGDTFADAYWEHGTYVPSAMSAINYVMRDHRSGETHEIDPRLLDQLHQLRGLVDASAPYQIISGYRSPASNAGLRAHSNGVASRSLHMDGRAVDIRVAGVDLTRLQDAALSMQAGGVGFYQASDFVHVDTGRVRRW